MGTTSLTTEKVIVLTDCNKKVRIDGRKLKKDNYGVYFEDCKWANEKCNCTCNVQVIG